MAKLSAVDITSLLFQEGAAPATPAATKWRVYAKTDGLYYKDDAGVETGPLAGGGTAAPVPWLLVPDTGMASVGNAAPTANAGYIVPATLTAAATITGIAIRVVLSAGNISVALYDASYNRLATSGSVACPAIGHASVSFTGSYAAAAGRYWLGLSASSASASFVYSSNTGTAAGAIHGHGATSVHPLPDPFVVTTAARAYSVAGLISGGWTA